MNAIRIGRDINVKWCVTMGNKAVDLDKLDLSIILQAPNNYRREMPFKVIEDPETGIKNIIRFNFLGVDQKVTGEYIITLYLNKNKVGLNILDKHFIRLVPRTWSENCNCSESLQTEQILLDGDMTGDYIGHAELESILSSYIKAEDIDEDGNINFNVDLSNYYTKTQSDNKFATKTSVVTKAEAETLISQKVDEKLEEFTPSVDEEVLAEYAKLTDLPATPADCPEIMYQLFNSALYHPEGWASVKASNLVGPGVTGTQYSGMVYTIRMFVDDTPGMKYETDGFTMGAPDKVVGYKQIFFHKDDDIIETRTFNEKYYGNERNIANKTNWKRLNKDFVQGSGIQISSSNVITADLSGVYTKSEADDKFLLKEDVPEAADLSNYVTKDELTGKGYLTEHQDISGKADANSVYTKTEIDNKGYLTEHQSLGNYYTKTETDNKFLLKEDVPEAADLSNYVTNEALNAKGYLTEHQDISGKANSVDVYTKTEIDNKGFLTEHQDISGKANSVDVYTKGEIDSKGYLTEHQDITGKADLSEVYTKGEIDSKGFLTEHQDISGKADANSVYTKTEIDNKNLASKSDLNSYLLLSGGTLTNRLTVGDKDNNSITNAFTHLRKVNDGFVGMAFSVGGDSTASIQHKIYTTDFGSARNDAVLRFDSTNGLEFGTAASGNVSTYKKVLLDGDAYTKTETDNKFDKLVWEGTQEQYDALSETDKAAYKIYAIIEE